MAEEEKKEGKEEAEKKEKAPMNAKKKGIIIGVVVLVVLVVQVVTAYVFVKMIKGEDPTITAMKKLEEDEKLKAEMLTKFGAVLDAPIDITVNIAGSKGSHYLKTVIQLEWNETEFPDLREAIMVRMVKIKDIMIDILSTQSMEDLKSSSGKQRVREAIRGDINTIIPKESGQVTNVLFEEFIIQ